MTQALRAGAFLEKVREKIGFKKAAFFLYLLSISMIPFHRFLSLAGEKVHFSDMVFLLAFLLWLGALICGQERLQYSKLYLPLTIYLLTMMLSLNNTPTLIRSAVQLLGNIYLMSLLVLTFHFARSERHLRQTVIAFLLGVLAATASALAGVGLFYWGVTNSGNPFFWHYGTLPPGHYPRISGLFANGNTLCNYLIIGFFVLVGFWRELQPVLGRVLLGALGLAMLGAAFFTFSVGWGGFVAGGMLILWIASRQGLKLSKTAVACGLVLGALTLVGLSLVSTMMLTDPVYSYEINEGRPAVVSPADHGITLPGNIIRVSFEPSVRVASWKGALQTIGHHPVIGQGIGTWVAPTRHPLVTGGVVSDRDAHNAYLNILGQLGVLGFFALGFLLWRLLNRPQQLPLRWPQLSLLAAIVGAFFFQGLFGSVEEARHLWWLFGLWHASILQNIKPVPIR